MCIRRSREKAIDKTRESGEMRLGFRGIVERGGIQAMKRRRFGGLFAPRGGLFPRRSAAEMLLRRRSWRWFFFYLLIYFVRVFRKLEALKGGNFGFVHICAENMQGILGLSSLWAGS